MGLPEVIAGGFALLAAVLGFFAERRQQRVDRQDGERIARLELQVEHLSAEVSEASDALDELLKALRKAEGAPAKRTARKRAR